jgi:uncharacterized protein involved in outer membrane biogenesis
MKLWVRLGVGIVVLAIVVILAGLVLLPRLLSGDAMRARIEQAAREGTGRELRYESLEVGLLPPSLRVIDTALSGATESDPPLLEAREIDLRVALLPLLFGTVVVDSLVADGATLRLTRTADGIELPRPADEADEPEDAPPDADPPGDAPSSAEGGSETGSVGFAVRRLRLSDSTLRLVDRAVSPAVNWELREIDASGRGSSLDGPIAVEVEAVLASGGRFALEGTASLDGELDLSARLEAVAIDPLAPYLGDGLEIAGRLDGSGAVSGPAASPQKLEVDLHGEDIRFRRDDLSLRGAIDLRAELRDPAGQPAGKFEVDATGAELEVGGGFTKPSGTPATVTGRIAGSEGGGLAFDEVRLLIRNFEATGRVSSLDPLSAELSADSFELDGWESLLPGLATSPPSGRISIEGLAYRAEPPELQGALRLADVVLRSPDAAPITLRGVLLAKGQDISSEDLVAETGGQALDLDARLRSLFDSPRYDFAVRAKAAESNALLTSLLSKPDTLYGPLGLDASFRGPVGGELLPSLGGRIDFSVVPGRLVGVSLLQRVFDRLGSAGSLALDLGKAFGGRDLQRFYGDEFERLSGVLDIQGGVARTNDLTFLYEGYGVVLRGTLNLADLALDMRGELTLHEVIDAKLARELGARDSYRPRRRSIGLAAVRGTLDDPSVRVDARAAVQLAAAYASGGIVDEALGGVLGDDAEDIVEGVLEGILGGRRR